MFKRKKKLALMEAKMVVNGQYGKATSEPTEPYCKHASQIGDKVWRLETALYQVYDQMDLPIYAVHKKPNYATGYSHKYEVVHQITGDKHTTFPEYPKGEMLANLLCDALNAEVSKRRKAGRAKGKKNGKG